MPARRAGGRAAPAGPRPAATVRATRATTTAGACRGARPAIRRWTRREGRRGSVTAQADDAQRLALALGGQSRQRRAGRDEGLGVGAIAPLAGILRRVQRPVRAAQQAVAVETVARQRDADA